MADHSEHDYLSAPAKWRAEHPGERPPTRAMADLIDAPVDPAADAEYRRERRWANSPVEHEPHHFVTNCWCAFGAHPSVGLTSLDHVGHRVGARCPDCGVDSTPSVDADYPPTALVMADVKLTRIEWNMVLSSIEGRAEVFDDLDEVPTGTDYRSLARRIRAAVR
jgi:hypothetical protein